MSKVDFVTENGVNVQVDSWWAMENRRAQCRGRAAFVSSFRGNLPFISRAEFRTTGNDMSAMLSSMNHMLMWCCENGYLKEETRGPLRCTTKLKGTWLWSDNTWKMFDKDKDEWVQRAPWENAEDSDAG